MTSPDTVRSRIGLFLLSLIGCTSIAEGPAAPDSAGTAMAARAAAGISVTAADPPYGNQGQTTKQVRVFGSGFASGDQASWERNGIADPKIQVLSTQFVSAGELLATINIALDAVVAFYDIAVLRPGRKGGIGTMLFEVTQATPIEATETAFGVNSAGETVGRIGPPGAFHFTPPAGLVALGAPGRAFDISEDGNAVVGFTGVCCAGAFLFERSGASWVQTVLPKGAAPWATAKAIGSDATTGALVLIGGMLGYGYNQNLGRKPAVWLPGPPGWTLVPLPTPGSDDIVDDISSNGTVVGSANGKAAIWEQTGPASWALITAGAAGSRAWGINSSGTLAVGAIAATGKTTVASYWQRSGAGWGSAIPLPGGCSDARAVDDAGSIAANGCVDGSRRTAALIRAPYTSADITFLGGLGDAKNAATVEGMSRTDGWLVGAAKLKSVMTGVYWQIF
jgi:hypothetical protein